MQLLLGTGDPRQILPILFRPYGFSFSQRLKLFGFHIFLLWAVLIKVIPDTSREH
jgi:hypothetical protein